MVTIFNNTAEFLSDHAIPRSQRSRCENDRSLIQIHTVTTSGFHFSLVEYCHPEEFLRGRGFKVK